MGHRQVTPHGQRQRQPDGYRVEHLRHVRVDEHVHGPRVAELLFDGHAHQDVVVHGVDDVVDHDHLIGQRQAGQDGVGRRDHVFARQDDDVHRVGQHPEQAHHQADVAVHVLVTAAEVLHALTAVQWSRRALVLHCQLHHLAHRAAQVVKEVLVHARLVPEVIQHLLDHQRRLGLFHGCLVHDRSIDRPIDQ